MKKRKKEAWSQQVLLEKCPECGYTRLIYDHYSGETACRSCGLVVQDVAMDMGPERMAFTLQEKESRSRVGVPSSYAVHDKGLSTSICRINYDAFGRKLPLSTRLKMWRLRRWQLRSRAHSSFDRNLRQAMTELDRLSDKVSIPFPLKEKAAVIYRRALVEGLVRGRRIDAIVAASLYAACRVTGMPRNLREIAVASLSDKKDIARCYMLLLRELEISMPVADPVIYLTKIGGRSNVSAHSQGIALKIINEAKKKLISAGKCPMGLAAAALYIACYKSGEMKTQKDIADAAGVTEVTIRNLYKNLKSQLNLEMLD